MDSRNAATTAIDVLQPAGQIVVMWRDGHQTYPLRRTGEMVIGRSAEAEIPIDDPSVSRKHATLRFGDTITIEDHGSANGTLVGGRRIASGAPTPIPAGALVQLGAVLVSITLPEAEPSPAPARSADVVVADPAMVKVHQLLEIAGRSKLSVLLLGETGVGKEVLAARVHEASPRATKPFVKINCAALVETLLEAELFGYERGAFTGAAQAKAGLLEAASGGTLFLDEVGEMPLATQAKLLRVLESGEVMRVGALKPRTVDVRFVSATNRDLREQIAAGRFREDLFFRLDGVSIRIPPLRERRAEIIPLATALLARAAADSERKPPRLAQATEERLVRHPWPGNVRELRNVMQRSLIFCAGDVLEPDDLHFESMGASAPAAERPATAAAAEPSAAGPTPAEGESATEAKRRWVIEALEKCLWNQTRAAQLLGVSRRTLQTWLVQLDIPRPRAGGGRDS